MKVVIILLFALIVCVLGQDKYTDKYDNIDLDSIINNERLFKSYVDCLLDKGKCTSDATELKKHIPEALQNECMKCSEAQKGGIRKIIKHLVENKKDWWNELVQKYDPEGVYKKKYEELSKMEGVDV